MIDSMKSITKTFLFPFNHHSWDKPFTRWGQNDKIQNNGKKPTQSQA